MKRKQNALNFLAAVMLGATLLFQGITVYGYEAEPETQQTIEQTGEGAVTVQGYIEGAESKSPSPASSTSSSAATSSSESGASFSQPASSSVTPGPTVEGGTGAATSGAAPRRPAASRRAAASAAPSPRSTVVRIQSVPVKSEIVETTETPSTPTALLEEPLTPSSNLFGAMGTWGVLDLLSIAICSLVTIFLLVQAIKKHNITSPFVIGAILVSVLTFVLFLLLEDFSGNPGIYTHWTPLLLSLTGINILLLVFQLRKNTHYEADS